jgi:hypothetical protein
MEALIMKQIEHLFEQFMNARREFEKNLDQKSTKRANAAFDTYVKERDK